MDPKTPAWALAAAAAIVALVGSLYAVVRFFSFAGDKWLEWAAKRRAANRTAEAEDRKAAGEPWAEVVERLTNELKDHDERLRRAENGLAACRASEDAKSRLLRFVFAWGKSRGMKISEDVEREIREALGDGAGTSGTHDRQRVEGDDS